MKKFNDTNAGTCVLLLMACLGLCACSSDNDNFPQDYVGFEKTSLTVECDKSQAEKELKVTIVAMEKSKEDRTMSLSTPPLPPGVAVVAKLTENKVTIKAGKKSATTIIKIYPKQMVMKQQNIVISCIPQWKDGRSSKLTLALKQKK